MTSHRDGEVVVQRTRAGIHRARGVVGVLAASPVIDNDDGAANSLAAGVCGQYTKGLWAFVECIVLDGNPHQQRGTNQGDPLSRGVRHPTRAVVDLGVGRRVC